MSKYVGVFDGGYARPSREARKFHGRKCPYCLKLMRAPRYTKVDAIGDLYPSEDHVVPRSKGGQITIIVCRGCNGAKGDMMPDEFLETLHGCQKTSARIAMIGALIKEAKLEELKAKLPFHNTAMNDALLSAKKRLQEENRRGMKLS